MPNKNKSKSWFAKQLKLLQKQLDLLENNEAVEESPTLVDPSIGVAVPISETVGTNRYPDVYFDLIPNEVVKILQEESAITFYCENGLALRIYLLSNTLWRFRYAVNGQFKEDFSYAIAPSFKSQTTPYIFEEKKQKVRIQTQKVICEISKTDLNITITDLKGNVICEDDTGFLSRRTLLNGITKVSMTKKVQKEENFYGLGDKTGPLNLRGQQLKNYNADAFGFGKDTDPLYRSIPFYYGLNKGIGYGIFFNNTYQSHFNFDKKNKGQLSFFAEGGEMDYYFIYGPSLLSVAEKYTDLTGRPELPPLWSLGFHQCRWSYFPDKRVKEVASEFRKRAIPCDAIYLDIDYMDAYKCFTWDKNYFPDPKGMVHSLKEQGFQTVVMIDPGIKIDKDYFVYEQGIENNYFCKRSNGDLMEGPVWPPNCVWPDYTHPKVRKWWGDLYEELYNEIGISGFWNDMNEPAMFQVDHKTFPDEVLHHYEGNQTNHAKAHNIYGQQMSRATLDGLQRLQPQKRPFLVTRASFSGGQRYAAVWTGDNMASWEHLHIASTQCQRLSISGFSFVGSDIGGFFKYPDGELMVRWLQLGIFHPFYRVHSMGNNDDGSAEVDAEKVKARDALDRLDQEPWAFGKKYTSAATKAIELRYQLLPYLYTAFWQYVQKGTPMIKQLCFFDQQDRNTFNREDEFIVGNSILVHPVKEAKAKKVSVYLPKGRWFDFWTGTVYEGKQLIKYKVDMDHIPIFILAGGIIPMYPVMQYTNEKPVGTLGLKVYYSDQNQTQYLYEDEGDGYEYKKKHYSLKTFHNKSKKKSYHLQQETKGHFNTTYDQIEIDLIGLPEKIKSCQVDDKEVKFSKTDFGIKLMIPEDFKQLSIEYK